MTHWISFADVSSPVTVKILVNAELRPYLTLLDVQYNPTPTEIRELCKVEESAQGLLQAAMKQLYFSARAFHRILKLALTIADLDSSDVIKAHHVAEAIQYRPRRTED